MSAIVRALVPCSSRIDVPLRRRLIVLNDFVKYYLWRYRTAASAPNIAIVVLAGRKAFGLRRRLSAKRTRQKFDIFKFFAHENHLS